MRSRSTGVLLWGILAAGVLTASLILGQAVPVRAAYGTCTPNDTHIGAYDGNAIPASSGTKAWINTDEPQFVCEDTSMWVVLDSGGQYEYAQVGLDYRVGYSPWIFVQWANTTGYSPARELQVAPSGKYPYAVKYDSIDYTYYFKCNNTVVASASDLGWTAHDNQWEAEPQTTQDYVPGTASNPAKEYNMQYMLSGTWYYTSTSVLQFDNSTPDGTFSSKGWDYLGVWDIRS